MILHTVASLPQQRLNFPPVSHSGKRETPDSGNWETPPLAAPGVTASARPTPAPPRPLLSPPSPSPWKCQSSLCSEKIWNLVWNLSWLSTWKVLIRCFDYPDIKTYARVTVKFYTRFPSQIFPRPGQETHEVLNQLKSLNSRVFLPTLCSFYLCLPAWALYQNCCFHQLTLHWPTNLATGVSFSRCVPLASWFHFQGSRVHIRYFVT